MGEIEGQIRRYGILNPIPFFACNGCKGGSIPPTGTNLNLLLTRSLFGGSIKITINYGKESYKE